MKLHVLNPVAQTMGKGKKVSSLAPRLPKLEGKRIGLYWNHKPGGNAAVRRAGELLKARFAGLEIKNYVGSVGSSNRFATKDDVKRISDECAAVIGATGD